MTRARNRRRRAPLHPSTTGSFHPIKVDSNGTDCKINGSVEKVDSTPANEHHRQQAANAGNKGVEDPQIGKNDVNGRHSQGHISPPCPHHHHHHLHHKQHKREGKDASDLRKTLVSKHEVTEDGKSPSKPQEYTPYMAARAKELKEEGNRLFQKKDYLSAMDHYELALKLIPPDHPDRAIFHSNRAACLMQMKPVKYEDAIHECNLALYAHPGFPRALLRRARAFEATGELELALEDVELLLQGDISHPDAVEMARRIRLCIENEHNDAQQDDQGMLSTPMPPSDEKSCAEIPANARAKFSEVPSVSIPEYNEESEVNTYNEDDDGTVLTPAPSSRQMQTLPKPASQKTRFQPMPHPPPHEASPHTPPREESLMTDSSDASNLPSSDPCKSESLKKVIHQDSIQVLKLDDKTPHMRPLKLIYDHDIRLAEMPVDCKFGDLKMLVRERFPSSKSILIKYKDIEGDLVTITSTHDLRLAEAAAAIDAASRSFRMPNFDAFSQGQHNKDSTIGLPVVPSSLDQLRLHVVEVPADQEPHDNEEISLLKAEDNATSRDGIGNMESLDSKCALDGEAKSKGKEDFDKWLLDFAQLFRAHLGIDPNGHIDLHERGMELCAEALEEVASTDEAHKLFDRAAFKFQEMAALGFLNWGNVYMCAARKQLPHDDSEDIEMDFCNRLQVAFDWAQAQYALAEQKFTESMRVKPDFCDAMLSLGQKDFESAKLHWSLAIAKQTDLSSWDSSEMLKLFGKAEKTMQEAADLVEKQECSTNKEIECSTAEMDDASELQGSSNVDRNKLAFGQDVALKSQVYLFWGNILYEHSQVVFRLGLPSWKELLDSAVEKFEVAGASPLDVSTALQKHLSNSTMFLDINERIVQQEDLKDERDEIVDTKEPAQNIDVGGFLTQDDSKDWKDMARVGDQSDDQEDMARDDDQSKDGKDMARDGDLVDQRRVGW